ncbi:MAG: FAD binding domain-containing protein, partial [Candidatus Aminicenantales bacterium]
MREFRIAQPKTVEELAALLAEAKEKALIMAGGTDLIDELKSGVAAPDMVVDIQGVAGLAVIARDKDGLRIGPMTTVAALAGSADVAREFPVLVEAALS